MMRYIICSLPALVSPIPSACNNIAVGIPTFFDLPQTTAFLPKVSIPKIETIPFPLQNTKCVEVYLCEPKSFLIASTFMFRNIYKKT